MKKTTIKIILMIIVLITIIFAINSKFYVVKAFDPVANPDEWQPTGEVSEDAKFTKMVGKVLGIINTVGVVVAVVSIIAIGIKYIMGSVEEKAEYKSTMVTYLIGAFLIFSVTTLPNVIYNLVNDEGTTGGSQVERKLYCPSCGEELSGSEQRRGKCSNCDESLAGIGIK